MRKILFSIAIATLVFSACNRQKDRVVAQVYQYKLYLTEIQEIVPQGLTQSDSLQLVNDYIDSWVKEKLVLHEAEKKLSPFEKHFEKEISNYRNSLIINKYYEKLCKKDTQLMNISEEDIKKFAHSLDNRYTVEKEIVRLNYVKIPTNSVILANVEELLFDEERRKNGKDEIAGILGDTIEYMLDDDEWLYLDDIQNEVAFQIDIDIKNGNPQHVKKTVGEYTILLVILDYRNQRSVNETNEERAAAEMLLINQRKTQYLNEYIENLYNKALSEGKIVR